MGLIQGLRNLGIEEFKSGSVPYLIPNPDKPEPNRKN
jgi:hypothetical protein